MSYDYSVSKKDIFTDEGQKEFLRVRDHVKKMIELSGAFMMIKAWHPISGSTDTMMAYVDRLVELEEIIEIKYHCMGQHRVFIKGY